jgi:hypothetical protein
MEIAKYIGQFLLKNKYCYIPGLGNLELKKKPAFHDGAVLNAPGYEVAITPGGSIDDTLANFIATSEQISISKASNALRDFSTQAKAELLSGKDVIIPSLGKFTEQGGALKFITDPTLQYTPPAIPTIRSAAQPMENMRPKQQHDEKLPPVKQAQQQAPIQQQTINDYPPYPEPAKPQVNWGKIAIVGGLAILVVAIVIFAIRYIAPAEDVAVAPAPVVDTTVVVAPPPPPADTNMVIDADGMASFKILLQEFNNMAAAEKKMKRLQSYGHNVSIIMRDSTNYSLVLPYTAPVADTTHVLDSIRGLLNPKGVSVYR